MWHEARRQDKPHEILKDRFDEEHFKGICEKIESFLPDFANQNCQTS
jgi:hypothetical protein